MLDALSDYHHQGRYLADAGMALPDVADPTLQTIRVGS